MEILENKKIEENLSIEFQPDEIGLYEIRIIPEKANKDVFNSFEFNVFDSSKLKVSMNPEEAVIGRNFKINGKVSLKTEMRRTKKPLVKQTFNVL